MKRLLIDTDIGGDIDDSLALAFATRLKDSVTVAVTTVNTDTELRARLAALLLDRLQVSAPVYAGRTVQYDGSPTHEKRIFQSSLAELSDWEPRGEALPGMLAVLEEAPGTVVGLGCWTNIAHLLACGQPELERIDRVVLMGGKMYPAGSESNTTHDPAAARYLLGGDHTVTVVPHELTTQFLMSEELVERLRLSETPAAWVLWNMIRLWREGRHCGDASKLPILHDPLAVAVAVHPDLVTEATPSAVAVVEQPDGEVVTRAVPTESGRVLVVRDVDRSGFFELFEKAMRDIAAGV